MLDILNPFVQPLYNPCTAAKVRGMASITQYRGKTWRAIVRRVGFPQQSQTFALKRDAEIWASGIEAKMGVSEFDTLQVQQATTTTVKTIFERYEVEVAAGMKGQNELATVRRLIRDAAFMRLRLDRVTPRDIRDWRDARVKEVQPQSVHREMNTVSAVFTHAIKEWSVPLTSNPCHMVSRFKGADKARETLWGPKEIETFLRTCRWRESAAPEGGRAYVGWALLLCCETAMRIGELCSLRVSDFHPDGQFVRLLDTKNGDARDVPLSKRAIRWLKHLCVGKKPKEKIVPVNANTLGEYVLDIRRACGLEHLVFHDSRRTGATALSKKLSNVLELAAVTGHRSLKSLQRYYKPSAGYMADKLG